MKVCSKNTVEMNVFRVVSKPVVRTLFGKAQKESLVKLFKLMAIAVLL
jgi:hypothetical protein